MISFFVANFYRVTLQLSRAVQESRDNALVLIDEFGASTYENDGAAILVATIHHWLHLIAKDSLTRAALLSHCQTTEKSARGDDELERSTDLSNRSNVGSKTLPDRTEKKQEQNEIIQNKKSEKAVGQPGRDTELSEINLAQSERNIKPSERTKPNRIIDRNATASEKRERLTDYSGKITRHFGNNIGLSKKSSQSDIASNKFMLCTDSEFENLIISRSDPVLGLQCPHQLNEDNDSIHRVTAMRSNAKYLTSWKVKRKVQFKPMPNTLDINHEANGDDEFLTMENESASTILKEISIGRKGICRSSVGEKYEYNETTITNNSAMKSSLSGRQRILQQGDDSKDNSRKRRKRSALKKQVNSSTDCILSTTDHEYYETNRKKFKKAAIKCISIMTKNEKATSTKHNDKTLSVNSTLLPLNEQTGENKASKQSINSCPSEIPLSQDNCHAISKDLYPFNSQRTFEPIIGSNIRGEQDISKLILIQSPSKPHNDSNLDEFYTSAVAAASQLSSSSNIPANTTTLVEQSRNVTSKVRGPSTDNTLQERELSSMLYRTSVAGSPTPDKNETSLQRLGAPHVFVSSHMLTIHDHIKEPTAITHLVSSREIFLKYEVKY